MNKKHFNWNSDKKKHTQLKRLTEAETDGRFIKTRNFFSTIDLAFYDRNYSAIDIRKLLFVKVLEMNKK